jgi:hypothetical protein
MSHKPDIEHNFVNPSLEEKDLRRRKCPNASPRGTSAYGVTRGNLTRNSQRPEAEVKLRDSDHEPTGSFLVSLS